MEHNKVKWVMGGEICPKTELKVTLLMFFKLHKWYQIAQHITQVLGSKTQAKINSFFLKSVYFIKIADQKTQQDLRTTGSHDPYSKLLHKYCKTFAINLQILEDLNDCFSKILLPPSTLQYIGLTLFLINCLSI